MMAKIGKDIEDDFDGFDNIRDDWDENENKRGEQIFSENPDTVPVRLQWITDKTDASPYKVFSPEFSPENVFVVINVPIEYVLPTGENEVGTSLTIEGLSWIQKKMAKLTLDNYKAIK